MLFSQCVAAFIDIVLRILSIGDVLEACIWSLQVVCHRLERVIEQVAHSAEPLELLLVERQSVLISSGQYAADSVSRVTYALQFSDNLVHSVYADC